MIGDPLGTAMLAFGVIGFVVICIWAMLP